MRTQRAFTLLEVMVAVAILGLSLTAILSAQAGLFSAGSHAQRESVAIGLVRCKMNEIEERMLKLGYPEVDTKDDGQCCEDNPANEGMHCSWEIQRVELPQPPSFQQSGMGDGGLGAGLNPLAAATGGGLGNMPGSVGAMDTFGGGAMPPMPNGLGAFGTLFQVGANDAGLMTAMGGADGGISGLASMMGGATSTGVAGLAPLVMGIVYPSLKPMLEASIRKVIVKVDWREGLRPHELKIIQYLTNPMKGGFLPNAMMSGMPGMTGAPGSGQFGATGATTAGGTTPMMPDFSKPMGR
jgi:general secretion pathway protein I